MAAVIRRWLTRRRCPHSCLLGIYGDAINYAGGFRLACLHCARLLDGPVTLAEARELERCADHRWIGVARR